MSAMSMISKVKQQEVVYRFHHSSACVLQHTQNVKLDVQVITVWSHWLGSKVKTGVFEAGSVRGTGGADYPAARGRLF